MDLPVTKRRVSMYEIEEAQKTGKPEEVSGSGTGAVVNPAGKRIRGDKVIAIGDGGMGKMPRLFYDIPTGIRYGKIGDSTAGHTN
jgi:branched-chain amino acid aminotransferase